MREIKFEYMCKHNYAGDERIFKHVLDLHSIEDTCDIVELICSEIDPCTCSFNESQNYCDCDSILDHGEFEIIARRQYTGLKDRNGVEIYEGDIVKWGHIDGFEERPPRVAIVKLEPALSFDTVNLGERNHAFHYGSFAYAQSIHKCMEVIGNIHQTLNFWKNNNDHKHKSR